MNYEDRGPGFFGLVRWERYCMGLDPDGASIFNPNIQVSMAYTEEQEKEHEAIRRRMSTNPSDEDRARARSIALRDWREWIARKSGPMQIHWNAKMPIVPRVSKDAD